MPAIEDEFCSDVTTVRWIINGYSLVFGVLIITGGRLANMWVLVLGMVVLGIGIGLFYSSITTAAITAVAHERVSLASAIVYMFQITGAVGLGLNTALVTMAPSLPEGIGCVVLSCL